MISGSLPTALTTLAKENAGSALKICKFLSKIMPMKKEGNQTTDPTNSLMFAGVVVFHADVLRGLSP